MRSANAATEVLLALALLLCAWAIGPARASCTVQNGRVSCNCAQGTYQKYENNEIKCDNCSSWTMQCTSSATCTAAMGGSNQTTKGSPCLNGACSGIMYEHLKTKPECLVTDNEYCQSIALSAFRCQPDGFSCPTGSPCASVFDMDAAVESVYTYNAADFGVEVASALLSTVDVFYPEYRSIGYIAPVFQTADLVLTVWVLGLLTGSGVPVMAKNLIKASCFTKDADRTLWRLEGSIEGMVTLGYLEVIMGVFSLLAATFPHWGDCFVGCCKEEESNDDDEKKGNRRHWMTAVIA